MPTRTTPLRRLAPLVAVLVVASRLVTAAGWKSEPYRQDAGNTFTHNSTTGGCRCSARLKGLLARGACS